MLNVRICRNVTELMSGVGGLWLLRWCHVESRLGLK